ncbi:MAG: hypothetical protein EOM73_06495 [Bacteroidia bacterium]|nr:hypothetical protein [Bacteroidia bacterium]
MNSKKIWLLFGICLLVSNMVSAQEQMKISFVEFSEMVKTLKISGFPTLSEITEEEGEYAEYQAYFLSGNDMFSVKLEPRKGGPNWSGSPYLLDGKKAEFAVSGNLAMFFVDLPATESVLTLISNKIKEKQQFEQIARKTGLLEKTPKTVAWPSEIQVAYRPDCVIVDIERVESSTEGYTTEYFLTVLMSDNLKKSVKRLRAQFEDNENYIVFTDKTVLTSQFGELDDLNDCCADNENVVISFQIP